jgi:hypothetical protein
MVRAAHEVRTDCPLPDFRETDLLQGRYRLPGRGRLEYRRESRIEHRHDSLLVGQELLHLLIPAAIGERLLRTSLKATSAENTPLRKDPQRIFFQLNSLCGTDLDTEKTMTTLPITDFYGRGTLLPA